MPRCSDTEGTRSLCTSGLEGCAVSVLEVSTLSTILCVQYVNSMSFIMSACVAPSFRYDYDLLVMGGGSGGLACAKEGNK